MVVGTGTEVGKTWVGAHLLRDLRAEGHVVAARKPAQSFGPEDRTTDAHVLSGGDRRGPDRRLPPAPLVHGADGTADGRRRPRPAAVHHRRPRARDDLAGAGSRDRSGRDRGRACDRPQAIDGDAITLVEELQPDLLVLVADAGLGTINDVRLSLEAIDRGAHVATPLRDAQPLRPRRRPAPPQPDLARPEPSTWRCCPRCRPSSPACAPPDPFQCTSVPLITGLRPAACSEAMKATRPSTVPSWSCSK